MTGAADQRRRRRPAPGTRPRILAAAADEFGARGFAATTVDRIARRKMTALHEHPLRAELV